MGRLCYLVILQMTRIYTRTGDDGTTGLANGSRVSKADSVVDSLGLLDLLNSKIGVLFALRLPLALPVISVLSRSQSVLFQCGAIVSKADIESVGPDTVKELEEGIDEIQDLLPELKKFILPGGSLIASILFELRAITRQAELSICKTILNSIDFYAEKEAREADQYVKRLESVAVYLNRLSDYLFVAARFSNHLSMTEEKTWN